MQNRPKLPLPFILQLLIGLGLCSLLAIRAFDEGDEGRRAVGVRDILEREQVLERAREVARRAGYDPGGWRELVTVRQLTGDIEALRQDDLTPNPFLSPFIYVVQLSSRTTSERILIELTNRGGLRRFELRNRAFRAREPEAPQPVLEEETEQQREAPLPASRSVLEDLLPQLRSLLPELDTNLNFISLSDAGNNQINREWTLRLSEVRSGKLVLLHPTLKIGARYGKLTRLEFQPGLTPELRRLMDARLNRPEGWLGRLEVFYALPFLSVLLIWFFLALAFRRLQVRRTWLFGLAVLLLLAMVTLAGSGLDSLRMDISFTGLSGQPAAGGRTEEIGTLLVVLVIQAVFALLAFTIYATGLSISIRGPRRKSLGLELLMRGRPTVRPATTGLFYGATVGLLLAAIPVIIIQSQLFSGAELDQSAFYPLLTGRAPGLATLSIRNQVFYFILFAIIWPLLELRPWRRQLKWAAMGGLIVLVTVSNVNVGGSPGALVIAAGLISLCLTVAYAKLQLLGVLTSLVVSETISGAIFLVTQPSASLQVSGYRSLLGTGIFWLLGLVAHHHSRRARPEEIEVPRELLFNQAERERLKAHFEVARRAQESLLPPTPPTIAGFEIAATCLPSREVGGDLYDFIKLPDGRVVLVVADVSGKGVSAALYMSLTKGLLTSLTGRLADAGEILRAINQQLYAVCRRRVFVTMFLAILDPKNGELTFARAGHNPALHFAAHLGRTFLLESRGIGLGLSPGRIFAPLLAVRRLELGPGDLLVLYSDGITEAMNREKEEYGLDRLRAVVEKSTHLGAGAIRDAILGDVTSFLNADTPQDDQTLVVLKHLPVTETSQLSSLQT